VFVQGAIPHAQVGTHRRVRFGDLQAYKEVRDGQRRAGLARLTRLSEDLGMYDDDFPCSSNKRQLCGNRKRLMLSSVACAA
jgi:hypothetical protein